MLGLLLDTQRCIFYYLNVNDIKNIGISFLYSKHYYNRALELLEWVYYKNKRGIHKVYNIINKKYYNNYDISKYEILYLNTRLYLYKDIIECDKDLVQKILYFRAWQYYYYKFKERCAASKYKIRIIKKIPYGDDSNFHIMR